MLKPHIIIILIHSLIFTQSCKKRQESRSTVKDVPIRMTAFSEYLTENDDANSATAVQDFVGTLENLGLAETVPLVIVNNKKVAEKNPIFRSKPTKEQILGLDDLTEDEELFFGSVKSRYVIGANIIESKINKKHLAIALFRFDTSFVSKDGQFRKEAGEILDFDFTKSGIALNEEITSQMSRLNSFMGHPSIDSEIKRAQDRLIKLNEEAGRIDTSKWRRYDEIAMDWWKVLVAVGVLTIATNYGAEYLMRRVNDLGAKASKLLVRSFRVTDAIFTVLLIALVVFVVVGIGHYILRYFVNRSKDKEVRLLKARMQEIITIYRNRVVLPGEGGE